MDKTFGQKIKFYRQLSKISQKDFAVMIYTTQQRVSEWEYDKMQPSLFNIIKILRVLNITFEDLIEDIIENE